MGPPLPDGGRFQATGLGTRDSLLYVPAGSTQGDLHHQRHRECECQPAIIKTRGHFPNDEAATKLLWLVLRNITAGWSRAAHDWKSAMNQFVILYEERFTRPYF